MCEYLLCFDTVWVYCVVSLTRCVSPDAGAVFVRRVPALSKLWPLSVAVSLCYSAITSLPERTVCVRVHVCVTVCVSGCLPLSLSWKLVVWHSKYFIRYVCHCVFGYSILNWQIRALVSICSIFSSFALTVLWACSSRWFCSDVWTEQFATILHGCHWGNQSKAPASRLC